MKIRFAIPFALVATLVLSPPPARAFDPAAVVAARRDLQTAVDHGDLSGLLAVRARFAALSAAEPGEALLHDWVAAATWRALPLQMQKDPKRAEKLGDDALDRLEKALATNPKDAEALALEGGLEGLLISVKPNSMMTLGPQSEAHLARAYALAPNDPRVSLLQGIGDLHKPAQFGGGPDAALPSFLHAEELFAKESVADSTSPGWGRDDAFLWEGRAQAQKKDWTAARDAFRKALDANPGNGWVRSQLLPEAEKQLAAAKDAAAKDAKER